MYFWCLQFLPKNERKQVDLRYHSSKVEFVCLFFGRIVGLKKSLQLCLTFRERQSHLTYLITLYVVTLLFLLYLPSSHYKVKIHTFSSMPQNLHFYCQNACTLLLLGILKVSPSEIVIYRCQSFEIGFFLVHNALSNFIILSIF